MNGKTTKLLKYLNFSKDYSKSIQDFSWALIQLNLILGVVCFWFIIFTFYDPYRSVAFIMLKFIRFSVGLFMFGFLIHYCSHFLHEITYKRSMKHIKIRVR